MDAPHHPGPRRVAALARAVLPALLLLSPRISHAQSDEITYQGVTLRPGDVVNLHGGPFTTGHLLTYGHTALYLGVDPETRQRVFLDFSTTKGDLADVVLGTPQAFRGRILSERAFLEYNQAYHPSFDIFQLRDPERLDRGRMLQEAKRLAATESWGPFGEYCSGAVAAVLSRATGSEIGVTRPDGFADDARFRKHPDLAGRTIAIDAALRELASSVSIVGTWTGTVTQPGSGTYPIRMEITSPGGGSTHYPTLACGGTLLGGVTGNTSFTFRETITYGRAGPDSDGCIDGTIEVRLLDEQTMSWSWSGSWLDESYTAAATLSRVGGPR